MTTDEGFTRVIKRSRRLPRRIAASFGVLGFAIMGWGTCAWGQVPTAQTPSLLTLVTTYTADGIYAYNALDFAAASANDAAYKDLLPICATPAGAGASAPTAPAGTACTGATLQLYNQLRALEDNANELLGRGEITYSLRLSPSALASALQWTAPEEFAAQGSMTTQFANSQATVLRNRFDALHFAAMATRMANNLDDPSSAAWAAAYHVLGGAAGADSTSRCGDRRQTGRYQTC